LVQDFVTVFEISRGSNGIWSDTLWRLVIGISALLGGVTLLGLKWRTKGARPKDWAMPLFLTAWSLLWLFMHDFPATFGHINGLLEAYEKGRYQVVEGEVRVVHQQPATGHTKGDIVAVDGAEFEVNYFLATLAYRNTIAHGGALRAGAYARVYHVNGEILRLDIRKP
jgi:hypothetical protein